MLYYFPAGSVQGCFDDTFLLDIVASHLGMKELISGLVALEQDQTPNEVGEKTSGQKDGEHRQTLPQVGRPMLERKFLDRIAGRESVCEASAHHSRKEGDTNPLSKIEFLDSSLLLFGRHDAFL